MNLDEKKFRIAEIVPPTEEECKANELAWLERNRPNSISFWWPKILEVGFTNRLPKTTIVECGRDLSAWAYGEPVEGLDAIVTSVEEACDAMGYPCFLRGSHSSAKHSWEKSCYVPNREAVRSHAYEIVEFAALVDIPCHSFAVRELLPTVPIFTAFHGNMPITREFRFFVRDGVVEHIQPYWPPLSIEGQTEAEGWQEALEGISRLEPIQEGLLRSLTEKVGSHFGGYWSVDWLFVSGPNHFGWYLTDMAEGDNSYKWEPATPSQVTPND